LLTQHNNWCIGESTKYFFFTLGTSKIGIKYKGTVEIANLSDENDMDDLDVSEPLSQ